MGAPAIPPPELGAFRIYYRDERNISIPFGWMSDDSKLLALDDGSLFVIAPQKLVRRVKSAAVLKIGKMMFGRMVSWWMHCMNARGERPGDEYHRLLGLVPPSHNPRPPAKMAEYDDPPVLSASNDPTRHQSLAHSISQPNQNQNRIQTTHHNSNRSPGSTPSAGVRVRGKSARKSSTYDDEFVPPKPFFPR